MKEWCNQAFDGEEIIKLDKQKRWDKRWINLAIDLAEESTCKTPNRKIGCVIVPIDNSGVLALGYNGTGKGDDNVCTYSVDESIKFGSSRCTCIHAEMNAFIKLDIRDPRDKVMYVTTSPCMVCAEGILNAGIFEVVYLNKYKEDVLRYLRENGVKVRCMDETNNGW